MKCPHKRQEEEPTWKTIMLLLNLVFLAYLASSYGQQVPQQVFEVPQYVLDQWIVSDESPPHEDVKSLSVMESLWPDVPAGVAEEIMVEDMDLLNSPDQLGEQELDEEELSALWKIILVAGVLLVSTVGSVSLAYYLCVWRGGRIHYQPHKEVYA